MNVIANLIGTAWQWRCMRIAYTCVCVRVCAHELTVCSIMWFNNTLRPHHIHKDDIVHVEMWACMRFEFFVPELCTWHWHWQLRSTRLFALIISFICRELNRSVSFALSFAISHSFSLARSTPPMNRHYRCTYTSKRTLILAHIERFRCTLFSSS